MEGTSTLILSIDLCPFGISLCMYVCVCFGGGGGGHTLCMVVTYSKGKDQPGKIANPARGQLDRENEYLRVPVRTREFGLARRVRQSRPASVCSSPYSGRIWCLLTGFLPSSAAASIYLYKTAIRHRVSPEFVGSRNCVPVTFTAESRPAQGQ